ncbi:MAG: hypothetical protein CMH57_16025 [Myxococcales bacterium]|nr:hypothetical protein [Myxococcales bacterium]
MVGWVAVAGCGELDYRPQRGFEAGGAAEGTGEPARDVRESGLWPGPCAETAYELPGGERSTFYTYTYNDRDLLSELRYGSVIDPSVASWRYEYDARGAMRAALFEPTGRAEYEYDARGFYDAQLWEANDDGLLDALILVSYDDTGRLSAVEVYDRNGALSDRVEYESNEALGTITEVDTRDASGRAARRTVRHYGDLSLNPVPWIHDARPGDAGLQPAVLLRPLDGEAAARGLPRARRRRADPLGGHGVRRGGQPDDDHLEQGGRRGLLTDGV